MAKALGESLGKEVVIEDVAWDGIIPALRSGKIDLIISSMTKTPERERAIDFSDGYVSNGLCMLVAADSKIKSEADLNKKGVRVVVKLATTGDLWAKANLKNAQVLALDTAATAALEVAQGKADAFIYDQISIYQYWQKNKETTQAILDPIRSETWGIGMRKGETELKTAVNAFLKEYRESGAFDQLAERYMAEEKKTFEQLGVPFIFH
ncbi:MAG: transporter substrate-binding domain-containing protein [Verrucomicrobiota bacterium]